MKLYMAVTADKYELPVAVEENAQMLARKYGVGKNEIYEYISRGNIRKKNGVKFVRIEV